MTFEPTSDVSLTWHKGMLAGAIRRLDGVYEIRPSRGGAVIEKLNMASFPGCTGGVAPRRNFAADTASGSGTTTSATTAAEGLTEITLLSVYTPQARDAAGGVAQIEAQIQAAVDNANAAFANSQVPAVYTLVHTALANYNDSGNPSNDLMWVSSDMGVYSLRNQHGADMVSLITSNGGGGCGIGYVMRWPGVGFESSAFQVTDRDCAVGNLTFAHEHGHNAGLEHDPANGPLASEASYPWSFGHVVNGSYRTVMSYNNQCPNGCTRVAYYSNPSVIYMGAATGVPEQRDNARTLRATLPIVANFRAGVAEPAPAAPGVLGAVAISASQVNLTWQDLSTNEAGFRVEVSSNAGASFSQAGSAAAGATSWAATGLASNTTYIFRVLAYNATGNSAYSNTASATTLNGPPPAPSSVSASPVLQGSGRNKTLQRINVYWTDASSSETHFELQRCQVIGKSSSQTCNMATIATPAANTVSFADPITTKGTYRYQIRSVNSLGVSAWRATGNVNAN